jgi:hypothetical protein
MTSRNSLPGADIDAIEQALVTTRTSAMMAEERTKRLLTTAFRSPDIVGRFAEQVRLRGLEAALAIAEGTGDLPRGLWFGSLRGGLLNPSERAEANRALGELRDAAVTATERRAHARDLEATRDRLLAERPRTNDREQARAPARERVLEQDQKLEQQPDAARKLGINRERGRS